MATFNLAITYPDNQGARILAALKSHYGQVADVNGVMRDRTNAEAIESLRQSVSSSIKDIVFKEERNAAMKAAADAVTVVDAS